jgi:hypothetical protein
MNVTWDTFRAELRQTPGHFLTPGDCATPRQLREHLRWLDLFPVEAVDAWVRRPGRLGEFAPWLAAMMRHFHPDAAWLQQILLGGYLRDLRTRAHPEGLAAYWQAVCAVGHVPGELVDLVHQAKAKLANTLVAPEVVPIAKQEQWFTRILMDWRDQVRAAGVAQPESQLSWMVPVLDGLIQQRTRSGGGEPATPVARVVFAWDHQGPEGPQWDQVGLAPGLLVPFELGTPVAPGGQPLTDAEVFDPTFLETVNHVKERFRGAFHKLRHDCGRFGNMSLKGPSGGLAIGVAQHLASRRLRLGRAGQTLPPWVALTASLDPAACRARPVNSFAQKVEVLRRAGVRVVVIAADQVIADGQVEQLGRQGLSLLRVRGDIGEVAEALRRQPRLVELWPAGDQGAAINRRRFLQVAGAAAVGGLTCVWAWDALSPRTQAMRVHDQALMRAHAREYRADPERYLLERTKERQLPDGAPEPNLSLTGLRVLLDSKVYDMVDWVDATGSSEADLIQRPIEPTYMCRVLRLLKPEGYQGPDRIAIRMDTAGHRALPILDPNQGDEVVWRFNPMKEARAVGGKVRSTYLTVDISRYPVQKPFDLVLRAIYWNGGQDQTVRKAKFDWWGTRLQKSTEDAELAVSFPRKPIKTISYRKMRYNPRPDGARDKNVDPWDDVDPAERDLQRSYESTFRRLAILVPVGPFDAPETIYAIQFSWS